MAKEAEKVMEEPKKAWGGTAEQASKVQDEDTDQVTNMEKSNENGNNVINSKSKS